MPNQPANQRREMIDAEIRLHKLSGRLFPGLFRACDGLQYEPQYWALVFPLGMMYAVATYMLVRVTGLAFLNGIAAIFAYVAMLAWAIVFVGMVFNVARLVLSRARC